MFLMLAAIVTTLLIGAWRARCVETPVAAQLDALVHRRWTWRTCATLALIPLGGSTVLLLVFFFTDAMYWLLLALTVAIAVTAWSLHLAPLAARLATRTNARTLVNAALVAIPIILWLRFVFVLFLVVLCVEFLRFRFLLFL